MGERELGRDREPVRERELVRELAREREPVRELAREREPVREREPPRMREPEPARMREPEPPPTVPDPDFNANADQNLADMAQRLEAALRRPGKASEVRAAEPPARAVNADANAAPAAHPRAVVPPPAEPSIVRGEPKPAKSLYDSLEKEMANLLGRPSGKS
jgi:hypothetical protein